MILCCPHIFPGGCKNEKVHSLKVYVFVDFASLHSFPNVDIICAFLEKNGRRLRRKGNAKCVCLLCGCIGSKDLEQAS